MNWDIVEKQWAEFKGQFKNTFSKFSDGDVQRLSGRKDQVLARVQQRYGIARNEADKRLTAWADSLDTLPLADSATLSMKAPEFSAPVETRSRYAGPVTSLAPEGDLSEHGVNSR